MAGCEYSQMEAAYVSWQGVISHYPQIKTPEVSGIAEILRVFYRLGN